MKLLSLFTNYLKIQYKKTAKRFKPKLFEKKGQYEYFLNLKHIQ